MTTTEQERQAVNELYHAARLVQILHDKPHECRLPPEFSVKLDPKAKEQLDAAIAACEQAFPDIEATVNGTALRRPRPGKPRWYRIRCAAGPLPGLHAPTYEAKVKAASPEEAELAASRGAYRTYGAREFRMIPAEAHSDDRVYHVEFDAEMWFAQATDLQIVELALCGWRNDYPADEVAIWTTNEYGGELAQMADYLARIADIPAKKDEKGFECSVDENEALDWIQQNRPHLLTERFEDLIERLLAERKECTD